MYVPGSQMRRSIRLGGYDYSTAGYYFVTVCVQGRDSLLGEVVAGEMVLNDAGRMVEEVWRDLPQRFPVVAVDEFIVMSNHFHGIVIFKSVGAPLAAPPKGPVVSNNQGAASSARTLGDLMRAFKSISAIGVNRILGRSGRFWQRNYFERVIRDEGELHNIRQYIRDNPMQWATDAENPVNHVP